MSKSWRKLVAILGVASLLISSNWMLTGHAEELQQEQTTEADVEEEETSSEEATETEETKAEEAETEETKVEEVETEETKVEEAETVATEESNIVLFSEEVQKATNLRWSSVTPGMAVFYNPNNEEVKMVLKCYKDGQLFWTWNLNEKASCDVQTPLYYDISESGEYTYEVYTFPYGVSDDDLSKAIKSETSESFHYTKPSKSLEIPANIKWDKTGRVSWDAVQNASHYIAELNEKKDGNYWPVVGYGVSEKLTNFSEMMASGKEYFVRVRAISKNINEYANGEYSDYVAFDLKTVSDEVNTKIDTAIGNVTEDDVENAVASVKEAFDNDDAKAELKVAMQTDSNTQEKIKNLEDVYKSKMGLSVSAKPAEDTGVDASSVKLLGAALNATEAGSVTFNMTKPDEETQKQLLTRTQYKHAIVLDLGLEGAGITKGQRLALPVTVTMAPPAGIDISRLTILHYNSDNSSYETLTVRHNADGTVSFTVTHFSNFVFAENGETVTPPANNVTVKNEDDSTTSQSTAQASTWKPKTADEIKRYAAFGKEKVVFTTEKTNAYPVKVVNAMQGKLCFDVFESVMGDYKIGRTYSIFPNNKVEYKMPTAAKITLTIPKELQKANREYKMICVTKNGQPIILEDVDTTPNTITFETDSYYAFALIYKDQAVEVK